MELQSKVARVSAPGDAHGSTQTRPNRDQLQDQAQRPEQPGLSQAINQSKPYQNTQGQATGRIFSATA